MLGLTAVQPDRGGVVDHDGEGRDLALGGAGSDGLEARVDTEDARVDRRDGRARVVKVGLSDSVVAGTELELDHGANCSGDAVRREDQRVVLVRDVDDLNVDTCFEVLISLAVRLKFSPPSPSFLDPNPRTLSSDGDAEHRGSEERCELHFFFELREIW